MRETGHQNTLTYRVRWAQGSNQPTDVTEAQGIRKKRAQLCSPVAAMWVTERPGKGSELGQGAERLGSRTSGVLRGQLHSLTSIWTTQPTRDLRGGAE